MERQESNESQKDLTIEECPSESNVSTADRGKCEHKYLFTINISENISPERKICSKNRGYF